MKAKTFFLMAALIANLALAEDSRQLAPLPPAAQEALREEMRGNLLALNEILTLMAAGKVKEAGQLAETSLGQSAMGKHRGKPLDARPGAHMPQAMHQIGLDGHRAASEFAKVAASGDKEKAIAELPKLTGACIACHYSWRTR